MKTLTISVCIIFTLLITIYGQDDDLRIYPTTDFHQTENSIAIDPTDPNNLISSFISSSLAGETKTPYFFSHDAGVTWEGNNNFLKLIKITTGGNYENKNFTNIVTAYRKENHSYFIISWSEIVIYLCNIFHLHSFGVMLNAG